MAKDVQVGDRLYWGEAQYGRQLVWEVTRTCNTPGWKQCSCRAMRVDVSITDASVVHFWDDMWTFAEDQFDRWVREVRQETANGIQ
jgi:hypothetical protein